MIIAAFSVIDMHSDDYLALVAQHFGTALRRDRSSETEHVPVAGNMKNNLYGNE